MENNNKYVPVPESSLVQLTAADYLKELELRFSEGLTQGRKQIIAATTTILKGEGDKVQVADNAEPFLKEFIEALKKIAQAPDASDADLTEKSEG
jgi:hypothetical protein